MAADSVSHRGFLFTLPMVQCFFLAASLIVAQLTALSLLIFLTVQLQARCCSWCSWGCVRCGGCCGCGGGKNGVCNGFWRKKLLSAAASCHFSWLVLLRLLLIQMRMLLMRLCCVWLIAVFVVLDAAVVAVLADIAVWLMTLFCKVCLCYCHARVFDNVVIDIIKIQLLLTLKIPM